MFFHCTVEASFLGPGWEVVKTVISAFILTFIAKKIPS
jgi:ABC-type polysaccharide/polyol phosphate export permease